MQQQSGIVQFLQQHNSNCLPSLTSNNKAFIRSGLLHLVSSCFDSTQNKCLVCTLIMKSRFIVSASPCMLDEATSGWDDLNRSHLTATKRCLSSSASHPFLTFNICVICRFPGSSITTAVKYPCSPGVPGTSKHKDTCKSATFGLLISPRSTQRSCKHCSAATKLYKLLGLLFQLFHYSDHTYFNCVFQLLLQCTSWSLVTLLFVQPTD